MRFATSAAVLLASAWTVLAVPAAGAGGDLAATLERRYECSYQNDQCKVLCTGGSKYINCGQSEVRSLNAGPAREVTGFM